MRYILGMFFSEKRKNKSKKDISYMMVKNYCLFICVWLSVGLCNKCILFKSGPEGARFGSLFDTKILVNI